MIGLIQRVSQAQVNVDDKCVGKIDKGILLFLGVDREDTEANTKKLVEKVLNYRIFSDQQGKMNLNLKQIEGQLLVVSQFTLVADTRKGNRPGFSAGASPELGKSLYQYFIDQCISAGVDCQTGEFGADMQVSLLNDGPVTFLLTS